MAKTRSRKSVGGSNTPSRSKTKSTFDENAAWIAKIKEELKALQAKNNKTKRAIKKKNKQYTGTTQRDTPCIGCVNSAAFGKSIGDCLDTDADEGERCTRYDRGGNVCAEILVVLVLVALHLVALREECWGGANSHALNQAIQAWKTGCEPYVSGAYDHLFIREREDDDPARVAIPPSIAKPVLKRASKNVTPQSTPRKKRTSEVVTSGSEGAGESRDEGPQDGRSEEELSEGELARQLENELPA